MYRLFLLLFVVTVSLRAAGQTNEDLNNKAFQLYQEGKYAEAISVEIKAIDAAQKEFGDTSDIYASGLNNLALLYNHMGNYVAAEPLYKQASLF